MPTCISVKYTNGSAATALLPLLRQHCRTTTIIILLLLRDSANAGINNKINTRPSGRFVTFFKKNKFYKLIVKLTYKINCKIKFTN